MKVEQRTSGANSPAIVGNNNTVVYGPSARQSANITSIVVETRLTAALREGAEIPPASVEFTPIGDGSDAHLVGPGGKFALNYVSPTRFRQLDGNRIVVINTFAAGAASPLLNRPLETLNSLEQIVAHPVAIVWGRSLGGTALWKVTIHVNGRGPWYYSYKLGGETTPDGQVPVFRVPLSGLFDRVRGE